ncbi:serine/threonine-protein kinase [Nonomuraea sp. NPDC049649]|uniref:serine/threonine-protein kinase n=1 Tax=Nonomuraea sp. NPDC049649 TaxID=3155776 RepID=UPI00342BD092
MSELRADDPRTLGGYRISGRLGQGGQGVVYLGHTHQGAKVAIKLLHASLSADPEVRRRFLAEIEAVRRVAPFCTAQLLDADLDGDRPYLVSEYVDGVSLREHVARQGPRAGGSLHRLAIGTATALGAIHRAGVVHRDFKPGNVLLSLDGPRVIDFGVSRLMDGTASTGRIPVGTPAYLAPERIKGEPAGPAADLYAWALTVAFTATGRHAFAGGTPQEVMARILYGKPDLGALAGRLRGIVDACLAPEPGDRPDAEEVLRRLLGQGAAGDVLTSGAMAAVNPRGVGSGSVSGVPLDPGSGFVPGVPSTPGSGSVPGVPSGSGASRVEGGSAGLDTVAWRVPAGGRVEVTGSRALARLVEMSGSVPVPEPEPPARRLGWPVAAGALLVALAVVAYVFWPGGDGASGHWAGSVAKPSAGRVFPVDIRLADGAESRMRWGAGLECSGVLQPTGERLTYEVRQVAGDECRPGTLRMRPIGDSDQMAITVTRLGQREVTYSGKVARSS